MLQPGLQQAYLDEVERALRVRRPIVPGSGTNCAHP